MAKKKVEKLCLRCRKNKTRSDYCTACLRILRRPLVIRCRDKYENLFSAFWMK
jgi:hypothetical protein